MHNQEKNVKTCIHTINCEQIVLHSRIAVYETTVASSSNSATPW